MSDKHPMRFVTVRNVIYYRAEDVADYIRTLGGAEETDVRTRLEQAALALSPSCHAAKPLTNVTPPKTSDTAKKEV